MHIASILHNDDGGKDDINYKVVTGRRLQNSLEKKKSNSFHLNEAVYWKRNALDICAAQVNSRRKSLTMPRNKSIKNFSSFKEGPERAC